MLNICWESQDLGLGLQPLISKVSEEQDSLKGISEHLMWIESRT